MMRVISGRCFRLNDSESVMLIISVNATVNVCGWFKHIRAADGCAGSCNEGVDE